MSVRVDASPLRSVLVALAASGVLGLLWVVAAAWKVEPTERVLTRVDDRGVEVAGYLATYLVPFLTVSAPAIRDDIAYGLLFMVVGVIYVRSSLISVNPLVYLRGFSLYAVETASREHLMLIARRRPHTSVVLTVRPVLGMLVCLPQKELPP